MTHSDFFDMAQVNEMVAEGCDPIRNEAGEVKSWKRKIYSFPPIGSPDNVAHVTAGNLDRFMRAILANELFSQEMTEALLTPRIDYRIKNDWVMRYGYCLWFYVDMDGKVVCYQKEGINAGVSGLIRHFPEQDINVVLLSNMRMGSGRRSGRCISLLSMGSLSECASLPDGVGETVAFIN